MHPDEPDLDRPVSDARTTDPGHDADDGSPRPAPGVPPPAELATPVPEVDPSDESARQAAATIASVSRVEEAN